MNDKPLVIQLKHGDTGAFKELYHKYVQKLYAFVLRTTKSSEMAEDVVHDVFVKVWENRHKLDPEQSFQAWLFTVARNHLLNLIKRKAHETTIVEEIFKNNIPEQNNTHQQLLYNESDRLFREAVEQLPEKRRQIFKLCHARGFTYQETADHLGVSSSTVNSQMVKAWKSIRKYFSRKHVISLPD